MKSIELFAGAGGLAMGASLAGFVPQMIVEKMPAACEVLSHNRSRVPAMQDWPDATQSDTRLIDFKSWCRKIDLDLLSGGPPCQPFSLGGKHKGSQDGRDMFPEMIRVQRETLPKVMVVENVKGFLRESFSSYRDYVLLQMAHPTVQMRHGETIHDHSQRLVNNFDGVNYRIHMRLLNAADYGVPQRRERVFIVAIREDLSAERGAWTWPEQTHHRRPTEEQHPWKTLAEALSDLPEPIEDSNQGINGHVLIPGSRSYKGHTGSLLYEPAKTLKAGDHGVPGGENMIAYPDRVRYLTLREAARVQTFPDTYEFTTGWSSSMRVLGNAVPVVLAEAVFQSVRSYLELA